MADISPQAESMFADFLARREAGESLGFEAWVLEHPEYEASLRALHSRDRAVAANIPGDLPSPTSHPLSFFRPGRGSGPAAESTSSPGATLRPGERLGDFLLIEVIGSGGMGQVWEAEEVSLGRRVALKVVLPERVDPHRLELFAREARAGGRLAHPGIVRVNGFGETDGVHWINEELVEGGWTLRDSIDEMRNAESLPPDYYRRVAEFAIQLAGALQAAHDSGVIHRDVKPQNVLITPEDQPKLTDFGLARITDETALSVTGEFAGTYLYMSPEQVTARRMGIDHRTDVFSLGVVLYEMLALQRPFEGDTTHQIAEKIVTWDPPDLHRLRSRIPLELAVICGKALEKRRDDRYATMGELAADLRRHLSNAPILARPPGPVRRAQKWMLRNPTKSVGCGIAVVAFVVISVLLVHIWRTNEDLRARTVELGEANTALEKKTAEAEANAGRASESAIAERRRADEVLRLSLSQDYQDLVAEAAELWPAAPENIGPFKRWIVEARALVGHLPELRAKRAELRRSALPRSDDQRRRERESHPDFGQLAPLVAEIEFRRAALAARRGQGEVKLPQVDWNEYPQDAVELNRRAWSLVTPGRKMFGDELLGLALAERAAELARPDNLANVLDTLACARFAAGDDEGAREASRAALDAAKEGKREEYEEYLSDLEEAVAAASSFEGLAAAETTLADLKARRAELEARVDERRDWAFPEQKSKSRWWNNQLTQLIGELASLTAPGAGLLTEDGVSAEHGWSMPRRLAAAERLRDGFAPGGEFAARWETALPAIRAAYPGIDLAVQLGLVPIGTDPDSKLWEFWHVQSGTEPLRGEDGRLVLEERSGLVLVLLPEGRFWMGAQRDDPDGRNYDPWARDYEGPVHEVELSTFFLSKYEMTQGQWELIAGRNPSLYQANPLAPTLLHPVEQVSWLDCMAWLRRAGLSLPSEAQWEYGCRGGTSTVWWTGAERESLRERGSVNLADQAAARDGLNWTAIRDWPELDDGYVVHAPVATSAANPFGLHGVLGNVWEWCLDGFEGAYSRSAVRDPVFPWERSARRALRSASFSSNAFHARSANRNDSAPMLCGSGVGVRPARAIEP